MLAVQGMLLKGQPENVNTLNKISSLLSVEQTVKIKNLNQKQMVTCDPSLAIACAALILPSGVAFFAKCRQS